MWGDEDGPNKMQVTCPKCKTVLEIPSYVREHDVLPLECGACHHRFTLRLNRPSLKVRNEQGQLVGPSDDQLVIVSDDFSQADEIRLAETPEVSGFRIEAVFGPIAGISPLSSSADEREDTFMSAVARAQNGLRERARQVGANGVVGVQVDSVGDEDAPAIRIRGTAVWLVPE